MAPSLAVLRSASAFNHVLPFWKIRARALTIFVHVDGTTRTTRVAITHIVVGSSVPSIKISNVGLESVPVSEKCSFVKATAAGRGAVCLADDDLTRVASVKSASAGTKNGDLGFDLGGTPALPFWKTRVRTLL